jgi:hypothetical protein
MSRSVRLVIAVATVGLAAFAIPASADTGTYAPGDVVTVDGASVVAPAAGNAVAISVDRVDGAGTTLLVTTADDGTVAVSDGLAARDAAVEAPAASPKKCRDGAYSLINGAKWLETYNWHYKASSTPPELTRKQATNALKASVNNITTARNGCDLADTVEATNAYQGSTTASSDVTAALTCNNVPNYQNVTEFGAINTFGVLAATCTYSTGTNGEIVAASVRINSSAFDWWVSDACSADYSLKAVQTHEYGHAFGMGHVIEDDHGNLTMSTNINGPCSHFEASLGKGDVLGLRDLY